MNEIIEKIAASLGLDKAVVEQVAGVLMNLLNSHGDQNQIGNLLGKIPGAMELASQHGAESGGGGGLMGMLSGAIGGGGGAALAAIAKLQETGLDTDQIKNIASSAFSAIGDKVGTGDLKKAAEGIPGLDAFI